MKNINKQFGNSSEESPDNPDPIIQAKDESGDQKGNIQPVEAVLRAKRLMPLSEASNFSDWYASTRNSDRPAWSGNFILKSIFRYKWTFLLIFILTAVPLLALIWTKIVPKYQARAEIRVRPIIPYLVFRTEDSGMIPLYSSFLNTQVSIIRSMTVLQRVLDQREIQNTRWYKMPQVPLLSKLSGKKISPIERLRDDLNVRPRSQTEIIDVSFIAVNAQDARDIVNAVLDEYLKYVKDKSDSTEDGLYRQLLDQYKERENEILGREKIIQDRLNALGTSSPQELVVSKRANIEEIQQKLSQVQQDIAILEWDYKKIDELIKLNKSGDSNNVLVNMSEQRRYYDDAEWRQLDKDVRTINFQIKTSRFTENNPAMDKLQEQLEFAEELLKLRETQIDDLRKSMPNSVATVPGGLGLNYEEQLNNIELKKERAKAEEGLLKKSLDEHLAEFNDIFNKAQSHDKDVKELAHARELYDAIRQRKEQKDMERNVPGSIEVLMRAFVPSQYYNDRRLVYSAMVLCLTFGIGIGVAFLRASLNQVIFTSKDMPLPMRVPHLGSIPLIRLKNPLGKTLGEEIEKNQIRLFESVRVIRTKLLLQLNDQSSSTVLISSSAAGTGKSSFIKVLGKCMAKTGKKVLMIDMDFYKRTLSKRFGLADRAGIINCLNSKSLDYADIYQTEISNLSILPAGKQDNETNVFEGIDNGFFGTCIEELGKQFSVIILDGSPVLPRADTVIMSNHVNGVILVERELVSRRENMIDAIERINSSGGHIWGVVFVGSSDYEKYDDYYYSYYETGQK